MKSSLQRRDPELLLREAGLRATRQRIALIRILLQSTEPRSVESIIKSASGQFDTATAYRMLEVFLGVHLVRRVELSRGHALYELEGPHHHHVVCISCGAVRDIEACLTFSLIDQVRIAADFSRIDGHSLEFFGMCRTCAKRKAI